MEELYLHYTAIGDKGLQYLLDMLSKNQTVRHLECGRCGITEKGAEEVIKAFSPGGYASRNQTLQVLGLFGNADEIDDDLPKIYELIHNRSKTR